MIRFLGYFSYIGTRYLGVQRQPTLLSGDIQSSVSGVLEEAMKTLSKSFTPKLTLASRTDKGVHAFVNAAHFDVETSIIFKHKFNRQLFQPENMVKEINEALKISNVSDIRVHGILVVPNTFHARYSCTWRTYVYRLAKVKSGTDVSFCIEHKMEAMLPISELCRCHVEGPNFDVDSFVRALDLCNGTHDFASFMASNGKNSVIVPTTRQLQISVTSGLPFLSPHYSDIYDNLEFYDVNVSARAFLYKQICNVVGAAIAVGKGKSNLEEVKFLLDNPNRQNWPAHIIQAPSCGLFLTNLFYRATDLRYCYTYQ